jgi:DNA primase large subunit
MSEDTTIHEAARYPWSVGARGLLKQLDISLEEIDKNERALTRARQRLTEALEGATGVRTVDPITDELSELASFYVAKALVDAIASMFLRRRWATAEAKRAEYFFLKETDTKLALLAKRNFEWKINSEITHVAGREFSHSLHFADYVAGAAGFHEREWKLVNKRVVDGYVLLRKAETGRVLGAYVDRLLLKDIKKVSGGFPPRIQELHDELEARVRSHTERIQQEMQGEINREAFPPCIKALLADMSEGKPLSHIARFALTAFLLNVGVDVDAILELFIKSPDFREDLARYQIEHIAGLRGSTAYTPPGCAYMVSVRLCVNKDATCEHIRHPLSYYRLRRRRLSKPKSS